MNAKFGCNDLFALGFEVLLPLEFGDDGRARGGRADAVSLLEELLALRVVHCLVDVFHGTNQRAFGEGGGRFRAFFLAVDSGYGQLQARLQYRQGLTFIIRFLFIGYACGSLPTGLRDKPGFVTSRPLAEKRSVAMRNSMLHARYSCAGRKFAK